MKHFKRILSLMLAMLLVCTVTPVFATDTASEAAPSEKEEVVYITLSADGSVKNTYVVNSFAGGDVTDYGNYASVKILNTSDPIRQNGDTITFSSAAKKVYYQGELTGAPIPWNISLRYFLDGVEYSPTEIAGKSGQLEIHFQIATNPNCHGTFFEDYALQASFTLDTAQCDNISAPDATIANVGSSKQLSYTILPGAGIDTVISADVTDFEMSAVSINGIRLNLKIEVEDTELQNKVDELIDAVEQLNDGASELFDGTKELEDGTSGVRDGASSLHSGVASLDQGIAALQNGLETVQDGLNSLNSQSTPLVNGSNEVKTALVLIQTAVNSILDADKDLSMLTKASSQIRLAINDLYEGAVTLQTNLGYAQYKALMAKNGLDIDALTAQNTQVISELNQQISTLQGMLDQIADIPGTEGQVAQLQETIGQLQQIAALLKGNNAAIDGMESYLDEIVAQLPALTKGLAALKTQYAIFDASIIQLVNTLSNMTGDLAILADGINQLVEKYGEPGVGFWLQRVIRWYGETV